MSCCDLLPTTHPERLLHLALCGEGERVLTPLEAVVEALRALHPHAPGRVHDPERRAGLRAQLRAVVTCDPLLADAVMISCAREESLVTHASPGSRAASVLASLRSGGAPAREVVAATTPLDQGGWESADLGAWVVTALVAPHVLPEAGWVAVVPAGTGRALVDGPRTRAGHARVAVWPVRVEDGLASLDEAGLRGVLEVALSLWCAEDEEECDLSETCEEEWEERVLRAALESGQASLHPGGERVGASEHLPTT